MNATLVCNKAATRKREESILEKMKVKICQQKIKKWKRKNHFHVKR